ncbi:MAG: cation:proton antiporter [Chlamydiota bacterium]
MESHTITLSLGIIIASGIGCQWISSLTRSPSILLLLLAGILLGPATGIINPNMVFGNLLGPITSLSVAVILFEGGMSLRMKEVQKYGMIVNSLVTIGATACALSTFVLLYYVIKFSFEFSLLQSAILVITGPTVVTPMLNQLHVKPRVRSILKWEGIIIDPIGAIAAVVIFEALLGIPGHATIEVILFAVVNSITFGVLFGVIGAFIIIFSIRKFLIPDSIHSPVTLMMLLVVYTASDVIHIDSGLISVTVMGFILGNQQKVEVHRIINFKENLSTILISFLFISLAGTIETSLLIEALDETLVLLLFLIFIARPLTVICSGAFWKLKLNEALFMCCIAPRGIVTAAMASLFGLELARSGYSETMYLTPITFGIIIGTVIFYSFFTPLAAHYLGVTSSSEKKIIIIGANELARAIGRVLVKEEFEVQLIDPNYWKVAESRQYTLPVFRGTFLEYEKQFPENIEATDLVLALTENNDINSLAMIHLRRHLEESKLYQLSACTDKIQESLMGQHLFGEKNDFASLLALVREGYEVKCTKLSTNFSYEDWKEKHLGQGILLFQINKNGLLIPQTLENPLTPKTSGKIIYLCND